MLTIKLPRRDTRPKTPRRIQAPAREEHTNQFRYKKRQPYTDGRHVRGLVLLLRQHEDSEDELGGENHLNKDTSRDGRGCRECGADVEFEGKEDLDEEGGENGAGELGDDEEEAPNIVDGFGHYHAEGYGGVWWVVC